MELETRPNAEEERGALIIREERDQSRNRTL